LREAPSFGTIDVDVFYALSGAHATRLRIDFKHSFATVERSLTMAMGAEVVITSPPHVLSSDHFLTSVARSGTKRVEIVKRNDVVADA
jgi:hypothetical protein